MKSGYFPVLRLNMIVNITLNVWCEKQDKIHF